VNLSLVSLNFCLDEWQDIWNCYDGNKFHSVYSTVGSHTVEIFLAMILFSLTDFA